MIQCDFGIDVASKFKLILANKKFSEEELKKENFYNIFDSDLLEQNARGREAEVKHLVIDH